MKKIAILFPAFWGGGAEAVAAWMMHLLMEEYDLTLITFTEIKFEELNLQYGTNLSSNKIAVIIPFKNMVIHRMLDWKYKLLTIRQHLLARYFRRINDKYDLAISAFNEMDLGDPGIQYIHYPLFGRGNELVRHLMGYPNSAAQQFYSRISALLLGYSDERMRQNSTITNSNWTAGIIRRIYGVDSAVLYPSISLSKISVPWSIKENGFIYPTRMVPEKKIMEAISVISKVRSRNFDVHLHILSPGADADYRQRILGLQQENSTWLFVDENLARHELASMMAQHRYGIHMKDNEPFGIAIAEMIESGCITFVPLDGGQSEVVGEIPELKFRSEDDAVDKICEVLLHAELQNDLRDQLSLRRNLFTVEKFADGLKSLVKSALAAKR